MSLVTNPTLTRWTLGAHGLEGKTKISIYLKTQYTIQSYTIWVNTFLLFPLPVAFFIQPHSAPFLVGHFLNVTCWPSLSFPDVRLCPCMFGHLWVIERAAWSSAVFWPPMFAKTFSSPILMWVADTSSFVLPNIMYFLQKHSHQCESNVTGLDSACFLPGD